MQASKPRGANRRRQNELLSQGPLLFCERNYPRKKKHAQYSPDGAYHESTRQIKNSPGRPTATTKRIL